MSRSVGTTTAGTVDGCRDSADNSPAYTPGCHSARPQRRYSLEARARGIEGRKTMRPYVRITRERPEAPRAWRPDVRSALGGAIGGAVVAYFIDPRRGRARRHMAI